VSGALHSTRSAYPKNPGAPAARKKLTQNIGYLPFTIIRDYDKEFARRKALFMLSGLVAQQVEQPGHLA
jgi:hypothetical protein